MQKSSDINAVKITERDYHNKFYSGTDPLPLIDPHEIEVTRLRPYYETGNDRYSDNKQAFHELIHSRGGWKGLHVLDYACGLGSWAVYYALTGATKVSGFDISDTAIRRGTERVRMQNLQDKVSLCTMDASALDYPDNNFDLVIGHAVIHHVIKYPSVFQELHRVMKPGTKAFFLEGLADFPLFWLWWTVRGALPQGDVPIFSREVRHMTRAFSKVDINGDTLLYSVKTFFRKKPLGNVLSTFLKACKECDRRLFRVLPWLRRWGSFSYLELTK